MTFLTTATMITMLLSCFCALAPGETFIQKEPVKAAGHEKFTARLHGIQEDVIDLTSTWDLRDSKLFMEVLSDPKSYLEEVRQVLQSSESDLIKNIALYSMQQLDDSSYLELVSFGVTSFEEKKLAEAVLSTLICPGYEWSVCLAMNHRDKRVIETLERLKKIKITLAIFEYLEEILSGKARTHILQNRENRQ